MIHICNLLVLAIVNYQIRFWMNNILISKNLQCLYLHLQYILQNWWARLTLFFAFGTAIMTKTTCSKTTASAKVLHRASISLNQTVPNLWNIQMDVHRNILQCLVNHAMPFYLYFFKCVPALVHLGILSTPFNGDLKLIRYERYFWLSMQSWIYFLKL